MVSQSHTPHLAVAAAQSIAQPDNVEETVTRHLRLASLAADNGVRMVIFPELSLTGYRLSLTMGDALAADDSLLRPLHDLARAREIVIVAGAPIASSEGLHIGAIIFMPKGDARIHLKQHLHGGEDLMFVPGNGGDLFSIDDEAIGLAICADITHPEHAANAAACGATIYAAGCFLTETGWNVDAAFLQGYAVEHGMMVLMANYGAPTPEFSTAGRSAIWSHTGELLACAPATGEALCIAERGVDGWIGRVVESSHLL